MCCLIVVVFFLEGVVLMRIIGWELRGLFYGWFEIRRKEGCFLSISDYYLYSLEFYFASFSKFILFSLVESVVFVAYKFRCCGFYWNSFSFLGNILKRVEDGSCLLRRLVYIRFWCYGLGDGRDLGGLVFCVCSFCVYFFGFNVFLFLVCVLFEVAFERVDDRVKGR